MTASPTASVMEEDEEYDEYDDCYGSDEEYDNGDESLNNLKQLGTALLLYADDWGGKLPKMDDIESVEEALTPYIHNTEFINPHTGEFYKPNSILTLHKIAYIQNPAEMVTFYELTPVKTTPEAQFTWMDMQNWSVKKTGRLLKRGQRSSNSSPSGQGAVQQKSPHIGGKTCSVPGADEETRTPDPRITNALLYQLSYIGKINGAESQN